jgi:hypothetical protein
MTIGITVCPSVTREHWAESFKVAGSIHDSATGIFPMCAAMCQLIW